MAALPVELIGTIASHLKSGPLYCGQITYDAYSKGQQDLAKVLRISKAVHEQCLPLLYHDCLVNNFGSFADALRADRNHPARLAKRIQLTPPPIPYFDLYRMLFESEGLGWFGRVIRSDIEEKESIMADGIVAETGEMASLADVTRHRQQDDTLFLPALERALFAADAEPRLPSHMPRELVTALNATKGAYALPLLFLNHPGVKHYCQEGLYGPLALPAAIISVSHPPDVVTIHIPVEYKVISHLSNLPVVLGATNRYMFASYHSPNCFPRDLTPMLARACIDRAFAGLLNTIGQVNEVVVGQAAMGDLITCKLPDIIDLPKVLKATKLEAHGAIQYPPMNARILRLRSETIPAADKLLAPFQSVLNAEGGPFKGSLLLKPRDEAPPCTGCDLDCQQDWAVTDQSWRLD